MEESGNAKERVTEGDSAREGRIDLAQFEEMEDARPWHASWYPAEEGVEPDFLIEGGAEGYKVRIVDTQGGITLAYIANGNEVLANQIAKLPELIAEVKKCYEIIDIYQSTEEDFNTQLAFHEKGLCEYLKHPCGPCEGDEGYYDDPLELSPELQAYYERGPSPRRTTEKQMEEAQRKREHGYSRPSVDDYDPVYDDPNYDEGPWE